MHSVLVLGKGSREHSIACKLSESSLVEKIFVAPGNGGTENEKNKIVNLKLNVDGNVNCQILNFCLKNKPSLIVIGPEGPLNEGIVNVLLEYKFNVFGPTKEAAIIECDKSYSKDFMKKYDIPTAEYKVFNEYLEATKFLDISPFGYPVVIKLAGLAAGKGVIIANSVEEAKNVVKEIFILNKFGNANKTIVIEQYLEGLEFSVLAFTDGEFFKLLPTAQDHKRAFIDDKGPNTGGMGAISPFLLINEEHLEEIKNNILKKTIDGLNKNGRKFIGILFAGLMLCEDNSIKVLEFNCRFGDPEAQTLIPLLKTDLFKTMLSCTKGYELKNELLQFIPNLNELDLDFEKKNVVTVVIASGGYPESSTDCQLIKNLDKIQNFNEKDIEYQIYHGGTYFENGKFYSKGGRVLSIVAISNLNLSLTISKIQNCIKQTIQMDNFFYRTDIGLKTLNKLKIKK